MPALLITTSIEPKRASVRSTRLRRWASSEMSPAVIRESGPPGETAAFRRPSAERAVKDNLAPQRANSAAQAAPMPSEAPVIRTTLFWICMRRWGGCLGAAEHGGVSEHRHTNCYEEPYVGHAPVSILLQPCSRHNVSMASRLIPLFPLRVVVFPRTPLPLHIFEERYKEMTGNAIRDHSDIGIVLAQEEGIVNAGCTVRIEKLLHTYPDGRMDLLTRGYDRFEIRELNQEKSYLQATVEFFDDDDIGVVPAELRDRALANYNALHELTGVDDRK